MTRTGKALWGAAGREPATFEEFKALYERSFDTNQDGKIDREEGTARRCYQWKFEREKEVRDVTYMVVERTIVIPNP